MPVTDTAAQALRQATAWRIMTLGKTNPFPRQIMNELFPGFANDEATFSEAVDFMRELVDGEVEALEQTGDWIQWTQEEGWCIDPEIMDGALVLSLYSQRQNKGLRIQQSSLKISRTGKAYLSGFLDVFGEGHIDPSISNLCVDVIPTEQNEALLRKIVSHWLSPDVDSQKMGAFLESSIYK